MVFIIISKGCRVIDFQPFLIYIRGETPTVIEPLPN